MHYDFLNPMDLISKTTQFTYQKGAVAFPTAPASITSLLQLNIYVLSPEQILFFRFLPAFSVIV